MNKQSWCGAKCERILQYLIARGKEASTYRGLILVATAVGANISPTAQEAIIAVGLLATGLVGVVFPDPNSTQATTQKEGECGNSSEPL